MAGLFIGEQILTLEYLKIKRQKLASIKNQEYHDLVSIIDSCEPTMLYIYDQYILRPKEMELEVHQVISLLPDARRHVDSDLVSFVLGTELASAYLKDSVMMLPSVDLEADIDGLLATLVHRTVAWPRIQRIILPVRSNDEDDSRMLVWSDKREHTRWECFIYSPFLSCISSMAYIQNNQAGRIATISTDYRFTVEKLPTSDKTSFADPLLLTLAYSFSTWRAVSHSTLKCVSKTWLQLGGWIYWNAWPNTSKSQWRRTRPTISLTSCCAKWRYDSGLRPFESSIKPMNVVPKDSEVYTRCDVQELNVTVFRRPYACPTKRATGCLRKFVTPDLARKHFVVYHSAELFAYRDRTMLH